MTVSVVSHGHGNDILLLLEDMALLTVNEVAKVIITLNVPEELLTGTIHSKRWPFVVEVISNATPLGFGSNHNQAFVHCETSFFCVVNPDVRIRRNPFPALLDALSPHCSGCAYPMQSVGGDMPQDIAREMPTPSALIRRYLMPGYSRKAQPRDWINGAFMLFPSNIYAQINGFDSKFFMYCEDVDICLRLRKNGLKLMPAPNACIDHCGRHASRRNLRHFLWHFLSLLRLWNLKRLNTY